MTEPADYASLQTYIDKVVQAAIDADLAHRDFEKVSDDRWVGMGGVAISREGGTITFENPHAGGRGGPGVDPGRIEESMRPVAEIYAREVFQFYETGVRAVFADWSYLPEPTGFDYDIAALRSSATEICARADSGAGPARRGRGEAADATLRGDMDNLHTTLLTMKGRAARDFGQDWVAYLPGVVDNDHLVLTTLGVALTSEQALIKASRDDIATLARDAEIAMQQSAPSSGFDNVTVGLTILAAVLTGLAAIPTLGTSVPAFMAALGGIGAATTETVLGARKDPRPLDAVLGGQHPREVLTKLTTARDDLARELRQEEEALRDMLDEMLGLTHDGSQFDLSRPALLRVDKARLYVDEHEILVTRDDVVKIVDIWLPNISSSLHGATRGLTSTPSPWFRSSSLGLGSFGPYASYAALESRITDVLVETSTEIAQAAHRFRLAMQHLGRSDEDADAALAADTRRLERAEAAAERQRRQTAEAPPHIQRTGRMIPF